MPDLANVVGLSALAPVVDIAIVLSLFACTLACINASARIAFTMAHDGMGVPALARAHDTHRTPHVAIWVVAVPMVLIAVVPVLAGTNAVELTGWVGTLATFGFMLAYALVALAAPVFLSRIGVTNPLAMITGAIGVLSMAFIFWANWLPQFIPGGAFTGIERRPPLAAVHIPGLGGGRPGLVLRRSSPEPRNGAAGGQPLRENRIAFRGGGLPPPPLPSTHTRGVSIRAP